MSRECSRINGARFHGVYMENFKFNRERVLRREEPFLNKTKTIVSRPMKRLMAMDGCDEPSFDESSSSSDGRWIAIEGLRCVLIS